MKDIERYLIIHNYLKRKNLKPIDIASALNITRSAVYHYMHGRYKSHRFDEWINANLGIDLSLHKMSKKRITRRSKH